MAKSPEIFQPRSSRSEVRHYDTTCSDCGSRYLGPGPCPKGCAVGKSVQTGTDEMTKKVVDDNDLFKGMI